MTLVVVTGGRDYRDREAVFSALDAMHALHRFSLLVEGGQRRLDEATKQFVGGADFLAREWARARGVAYRTERADWDKHRKAAGPIRNQRMIDMRPALVIAFPGGAGTEDCCVRATKAGIPVSHVVNLK